MPDSFINNENTDLEQVGCVNEFFFSNQYELFHFNNFLYQTYDDLTEE